MFWYCFCRPVVARVVVGSLLRGSEAGRPKGTREDLVADILEPTRLSERCPYHRISHDTLKILRWTTATHLRLRKNTSQQYINEPALSDLPSRRLRRLFQTNIAWHTNCAFHQGYDVRKLSKKPLGRHPFSISSLENGSCDSPQGISHGTVAHPAPWYSLERRRPPEEFVCSLFISNAQHIAHDYFSWVQISGYALYSARCFEVANLSFAGYAGILSRSHIVAFLGG
ncbi:hypothetical protein DIPPA_50126 [Diplonema papillatum]|nr:hypothetical protein DIPPA_50126 [Diplonema papillatum]